MKPLGQHDKYKNFSELSAKEQQGTAYRIRLVQRDSAIAVLAPHGGRIEPESSAIAEAIAGAAFSFYAFSGCKPKGNCDLHLTATCFDEPLALALLKETPTILTVHGCRGTAPRVIIGGRDDRLVAAMLTSLKENGFTAQVGEIGLAGRHPNNLCNRGTSGMGVQLEISAGLRQLLSTGEAATAAFSNHGRDRLLARFVLAVRNTFDIL